MTPSETLFMEVLAARHRQGETSWSFDNATRRIANRLEAAGWITTRSHAVQGAFYASLTDKGLEEMVDSAYVPPVEDVKAVLGALMSDVRIIRRQETVHDACEGHGLCDLVHQIEYRHARYG